MIAGMSAEDLAEVREVYTQMHARQLQDLLDHLAEGLVNREQLAPLLGQLYTGGAP